MMRLFRQTGVLPLEPFELVTTSQEVRSYFVSSSFLQSVQLDAAAQWIEVRSGVIDFGRLEMNSYYDAISHQ